MRGCEDGSLYFSLHCDLYSGVRIVHARSCLSGIEENADCIFLGWPLAVARNPPRLVEQQITVLTLHLG
jgi:hypothetical protein